MGKSNEKERRSYFQKRAFQAQSRFGKPRTGADGKFLKPLMNADFRRWRIVTEDFDFQISSAFHPRSSAALKIKSVPSESIRG